MSQSDTRDESDQTGPSEEVSVSGTEDSGVVDIEAAAQKGKSGETEDLAAAQARADANWDKFLRVSAELDNTLRRTSRDVQNARKFALEKFAGEIIGVRDSLELGVQAARQEDASVDSLREGSEMTLRLLSAALEKFGIKEIDPEGEPFDPEYHEAMTMQESADAEPNSVLKVIQKGYVLNDRLLRPARVIVASAAKSEAG